MRNRRQFTLIEIFAWLTAFAVALALDRMLMLALFFPPLVTTIVGVAFIARVAIALGRIPHAIAALLFLGAGIPLCIFGWWGLFTDAGHHRYEELDAIFPLFALIEGVPCLVGGVLLATGFVFRKH